MKKDLRSLLSSTKMQPLKSHSLKLFSNKLGRLSNLQLQDRYHLHIILKTMKNKKCHFLKTNKCLQKVNQKSPFWIKQDSYWIRSFRASGKTNNHALSHNWWISLRIYGGISWTIKIYLSKTVGSVNNWKIISWYGKNKSILNLSKHLISWKTIIRNLN